MCSCSGAGSSASSNHCCGPRGPWSLLRLRAPASPKGPQASWPGPGDSISIVSRSGGLQGRARSISPPPPNLKNRKNNKNPFLKVRRPIFNYMYGRRKPLGFERFGWQSFLAYVCAWVPVWVCYLGPEPANLKPSWPT